MAYLFGASDPRPDDAVELPSFEAVAAPTPRRALADATRVIHHETNPLNARRLVQRHGGRAVVVNPLAQPMEVALGVLYLASDEASFVTGSELVIDGGWTAQ